MNKVKKLFLLVFSAAVMLVLTACGGQIKTDLTVKEGFSGSRVMTYSANLKDNKQYIKGDLAEISQTVAENTPTELTFEDISTDEDAIYAFTLNFSSEEDYKNKVASLLKAGDVDVPDPLLEVSHPDSIFASGIKYHENFNSVSMLQWFSNLLVENGYIEETNKSDIFGNGQTGSWEVFGAKSDNGSTADIDTIKYLTLNGVDVYTAINGDGTYNRTIKVKVPQSSMNEKGDEIKDYLAGVTDSLATANWEDNGEEQIYVIEANGVTADQINTLMATFCSKSGETMFTADAAATGDAPEKTFADTRSITESFSLDNYVTGWDKVCNFNYYVSQSGSFEGKVTSDYGTNDLYATPSDDPDWCRLFNSYYDSNFKLQYEYTYKFALADAKVTLKPTFMGKVEREVKLTYESVLTDTQIESLNTRITESIARANESIAKNGNSGELVLKKCESDGTNFIVIIKSNADEGVEASLWTEAFGGNNKLSVTKNSGAIMPIIQTMNVDDRFDMQMFTEGSIPLLTYTVKGIGNTAKYGADPLAKKGNNYVEENPSFKAENLLSHNLTGDKINIIPIALLAVGVLALLGTAGLIVMMILKNKKAATPIQPAQAAVQPTAQPAFDAQNAAVMPQGTAPAPAVAEAPAPAVASAPATAPATAPAEAPKRFCTKCGAPIPEGSAFCTQCGNKIS